MQMRLVASPVKLSVRDPQPRFWRGRARLVLRGQTARSLVSPKTHFFFKAKHVPFVIPWASSSRARLVCDAGWRARWHSYASTSNDAFAYVICLLPARTRVTYVRVMGTSAGLHHFMMQCVAPSRGSGSHRTHRLGARARRVHCRGQRQRPTRPVLENPNVRRPPGNCDRSQTTGSSIASTTRAICTFS